MNGDSKALHCLFMLQFPCWNEYLYRFHLQFRSNWISNLVQNGSSHFDDTATKRQNVNRHLNTTEVYVAPSTAGNQYSNMASSRITTFDQHTNPFVFKCELSFFRKISVSSNIFIFFFVLKMERYHLTSNWFSDSQIPNIWYIFLL